MLPTAAVSDDLRLAEAPATCVSDVRARPRSGQLVALFSATLFVSAFLMFLVEPMMARMVLPLLGGAPAVWNTCLVFFQAVLLGGYAYAHGATRWLGLRRHIVVHSILLLLPLLALPIAMHQAPPAAGQNPVAWLLLVLAGSIGLPFFVVSTSAAVLQKWFSATDDEAARDPYFLYVASNLGSFIALIAYPVIVEPTLRLQDQARVWTAGYAVFVAFSLACAMIVWRRRGRALDSVRTTIAVESDAPVSWARRGRWLALAFVPSSLLLAVTNYISTDVASVPLLWVVPLSLYLLAFVVAFSPSAAGARCRTAGAALAGHPASPRRVPDNRDRVSR
jgi:dipeptide/tripeptide permease